MTTSERMEFVRALQKQGLKLVVARCVLCNHARIAARPREGLRSQVIEGICDDCAQWIQEDVDREVAWEE